MIDNTAQPVRGCRGCPPGRMFLEARIVASAGLVFALAANQISPRGLSLARDYFPAVHPAKTESAANTPSPPGQAAPGASAAARIHENGLQFIERARVEQLFHDPRLAQGGILFLDARNPDAYLEGHIPGAWEFDAFHAESYLAEILPLCGLADQIIVYCTGGECEDSQSAALFLLGAGVPGAKLFVYGGGITDWTAAKLPLESGPRSQ